MPNDSQPVKPKKHGCRSCLIFFVILILILALLAGAGYYLVKNGRISMLQVSNMFGPGVGSVSITNLQDRQTQTRLIKLDTESGDPETVDSLQLEYLDIDGYGGIEPGRYTLEINDQTCTLQIKKNDTYTFLVINQGTAMSKNDFEPTNPDELDMETSSLCTQ